MKRFLLMVSTLILLYFLYDVLYYHYGVYIDLHPQQAVDSFTKTEGRKTLIRNGEAWLDFTIRGVDLGSGLPGHFATDYAIDRETYMRWFGMIQDMGANTIRVYTILSDDFYEAFYEYNKEREDPLYLLHGVWVNDYALFSEKHAFDDDIRGELLEDCKKVVDIIHGKRKILLNKDYGSGSYTRDISDWVIGYIIGVEWEPLMVAYTDHQCDDRTEYRGEYLYTEEASPFEVMLAEVGDKMLAYESGRYKEQRLFAFSNWPTTDPLKHSEYAERINSKIDRVDVEHIKTTDQVISGQFASYHIYTYYPDYLSYEPYVKPPKDEEGKVNNYAWYLTMIAAHHSMPVVISEYGNPTSRGMADKDYRTDRNQGFMTEEEQGRALIKSYHDIMNSGCAGSLVFIWQDEWFKRTWNTMHLTSAQYRPYWSDTQTNEQFFGLLSFDPGMERCACYVDGDPEEWTPEDVVFKDGTYSLSVKYDEKYLYFYVKGVGVDEGKHLYIPLDITPKSGSTYYGEQGIKFQRESDFVIDIDGRENSHVYVQERYDSARAIFGEWITGVSPLAEVPDPHSEKFCPILLLLESNGMQNVRTYETGKLLYGNGNPSVEDYNSLADFCSGEDFIELRIPWGLLNFSDPSNMKVHDDYYEVRGVEDMPVREIYAGIGTEENRDVRIRMEAVPLAGWGNRVTYHERLKQSYYMLQDEWLKEDEGH